MGWFSKKEPEPDPIGDICRLLVERWWEWEPNENAMSHLSGVRVSWHSVPVDPVFPSISPRKNQARLWMGGAQFPASDADTARLMRGIQGNAAARVKWPRVPFDDAARALAKSVLETGDRTAARALADMVCELVSQGADT